MEIIASPDDAGKRLDLVITAALPGHSRGEIQKAIRDGYCWRNDLKAVDPAVRVKTGERIVFELPDLPTQLIPSEGALEIIWQDSAMAVCIKPAGITVHPCPSCGEETLVQRLLAKFPTIAALDEWRPGIVHRLDKDTSGLIIVALTQESRLKLAQAFAAREIKKEYLALVAGRAPQVGECREPIGRHPTIKTRMAVTSRSHGGREAHTDWSRIWHNDKISLLRVRIYTGRTHQIRVHLAHLGFPILGDFVYAPRNVACMAPRQMLHAWQIGLRHPLTDEYLQFVAAPPPDFFETALANSRSLQKIVVTGNQGCGKSSFCKALANLGIPMISADQIVADLYAKKSPATDWIGTYLGADALGPDESVDKAALFRILQERPEMRRELEIAIHGLVLAEIEQFWQANVDQEFAVAEIPLYFESGYQSLMKPQPLLIGVSCPQEIRWRRIAQNRGWSREKIETIEQWQWPEARKMAACNHEIANAGSYADLEAAARDFLESANGHRTKAEALLLAKLKMLCGK